MENDFILRLYARPETVWTVPQISMIFQEIPYGSVLDRLHYFTKVGKLQKIHKGIYAKSGYDPLELANKIYTPSYISLETVLRQAGAIFQHYETIYLVSYITRTIMVTDQTIQYRKIKPEILTNAKGVEHRENYAIATPERAFLDVIYLYKDYHVDNLGAFNWEAVHELKIIYRSKALDKRLNEYYQIYKDEHA